jgi:hypothetical protein
VWLDAEESTAGELVGMYEVRLSGHKLQWRWGVDVVEDAKSLVIILDQIKAPALTRLNTEDDTPSLAFSPALQASASHLDLPEPENRKRAVDTVTSLSRDSLALRTGTLRPFASLQRRRRRSPRADCSCSSPPRRPARSRPQTIVLLMI